MKVTHRKNQGAFSNSYRTKLEINRRLEANALSEHTDVEEARTYATRIALPSTDAELRKQFMSPEALALKRRTPMFL
jgi:hypothetical protein